MSDIEIRGHTYRIGVMSARTQLHVARRLSSLPISLIIGASTDGAMSDAVIAKARDSGFDADDIKLTLPLSLKSLGMLSDTDCNFVVDSCLVLCHRKISDNAPWAPIFNASIGQLMYQDIDLEVMLELTVRVLQENLGSFFGGNQPTGLSAP
jgi:hypothetical protein